MGVSGGGVGNTGWGAPANPQAYQPTQNAADNTMAILTGRLPGDTYEVHSFTEMNPQMTWKYQSGSSNPMLDHPTNIFRVGTGLVDVPDDAWKENYADLVNTLPEDLQEGLEQNQDLPSTVRSPFYSAMDDVLKGTARFMAQLDNGVNGGDLEGVQNGQFANQQLPQYALNGTINLGNELLDETFGLINQMGPNNPNHDNLLNIATQTQTIMNQLTVLSSALATSKDPSDIQTQLNGLSLQLTNLLDQSGTSLADAPLQNLNVLINSMIPVVGSASLGKDTSAYLLLSLSAALTNMSGNSATNDPIQDLSQMISSSLGSLTGLQSDSARMNLLNTLVGASILVSYATTLATTGALLGQEDKSGVTPAPNLNVRQDFAMELSMILLLTTETFPTLFSSLGATVGASEEGQEITSSFLTTTEMLLIGQILSSSDGTPRLTDAMTSNLKQNLPALETSIDNAITNGTANADQLGEVRAAIGQAIIALNNNDMETFWDQYASALSAGGVNVDQLMSVTESIRNIAGTAGRAITPDASQTPTAISTLA